MAVLQDEQIQEMIQNIGDPGIRAKYEAALIGSTHLVKCLSKKCKGATIGEKRATGAWVNSCRGKDGRRAKTRGLRSSRQRLDGLTGFFCRCGNTSITSKAEQGIINGNMPTRKDLAKVYERNQANPTSLKTHADGSQEYDGFITTPLKGSN